ncbi:hypothetical protein [Thermaurantiacus sp.]
MGVHHGEARHRGCFLLGLGIALAGTGLAAPALASGIYFVDDSAITPAGSGQVESFASFTGRNRLFRVYPAGTARALPTVEWTIGLEHDRFAVATSSLFLQAKMRLGPEPEAPGDLGLAVSAGGLLPFARAAGASFIGNAILTHAATGRLLLHANLGAFLLPEGAVLTWGVRGEQTLVKDRLSLHAEIFGQSTGRPGVQLGLRPTLARGRLDLEVAFSHNLAGERANWLTLGTAFRF